MHGVFQVLGENANLRRDASEFIENPIRFTYEAHTKSYFQIANGLFILRVFSPRMDYERNLSMQ